MIVKAINLLMVWKYRFDGHATNKLQVKNFELCSIVNGQVYNQQIKLPSIAAHGIEKFFKIVIKLLITCATLIVSYNFSKKLGTT